ncbi:MAG: methionyl-tRNA formyltransferase [Gaiellales bacterium]|nr:MAG: methionyl-tRNA formyltransferase [Gaiellales bacterium]
MKIAFAGTPEFGALILGALLSSRHEVAVVFTQPDRPAGRGRRPRESAVKRLALEEGLRVEQPPSISSAESVGLMEDLGVRALTVAAFGQILKPPLLGSIPCINVHASLLPAYRGASPVERAVMAGEKATGVSIMDITPKLDTGAVYLSWPVYIDDDDDAGSMYQKLGRAGGEALVQTLDGIEEGGLRSVPQDESKAFYVEKITPADQHIDWNRPAWKIRAQVRGLSPHIGAFTRVDGHRLKVWKAAVVEGGDGPGTLEVEGERLLVNCGTGRLELIEVQPEGKRRMSAAEYLRGHRDELRKISSL